MHKLLIISLTIFFLTLCLVFYPHKKDSAEIKSLKIDLKCEELGQILNIPVSPNPAGVCIMEYKPGKKVKVYW